MRTLDLLSCGDSDNELSDDSLGVESDIGLSDFSIVLASGESLLTGCVMFPLVSLLAPFCTSSTTLFFQELVVLCLIPFLSLFGCSAFSETGGFFASKSVSELIWLLVRETVSFSIEKFASGLKSS